jgi:hypothetical protein
MLCDRIAPASTSPATTHPGRWSPSARSVSCAQHGWRYSLWRFPESATSSTCDVRGSVLKSSSFQLPSSSRRASRLSVVTRRSEPDASWITRPDVVATTTPSNTPSRAYGRSKGPSTSSIGIRNRLPPAGTGEPARRVHAVPELRSTKRTGTKGEAVRAGVARLDASNGVHACPVADAAGGPPASDTYSNIGTKRRPRRPTQPNPSTNFSEP